MHLVLDRSGDQRKLTSVGAPENSATTPQTRGVSRGRCTASSSTSASDDCPSGKRRSDDDRLLERYSVLVAELGFFVPVNLVAAR